MVAIQDRAGIRPGRPKSTVAEADPEEQSGGGGSRGGHGRTWGGHTREPRSPPVLKRRVQNDTAHLLSSALTG